MLKVLKTALFCSLSFLLIACGGGDSGKLVKNTDGDHALVLPSDFSSNTLKDGGVYGIAYSNSDKTMAGFSATVKDSTATNTGTLLNAAFSATSYMYPAEVSVSSTLNYSPTTFSIQSSQTKNNVNGIACTYGVASYVGKSMKMSDFVNAWIYTLAGPYNGGVFVPASVNGYLEPKDGETTHKNFTVYAVACHNSTKNNYITNYVVIPTASAGTLGLTAKGIIFSFGTSSIKKTNGNKTFNSDAANSNPAVDIMWVIDDSGSMGQEQACIAEAADNFFGILENTGLDFQMGVVNTETATSTRLQFDDGSNARYITSSLPSTRTTAQTYFAEMVDVGVGGGSEEGLIHSALALLDGDLANLGAGASTCSTYTGNAGDYTSGVNKNLINGENGTLDTTTLGSFLRSTASLVLIYVSDEEDQSTDNVTDYINYFNAKVTAGKTRDVVAFGIVGPEGTGCSSTLANSDQGDRYIEFINATGGSAASICVDSCSEFDTILNDIALSASGVASSFEITDAFVYKIKKVSIDGNEICEISSPSDTTCVDASGNTLGYIYNYYQQKLNFAGAALTTLQDGNSHEIVVEYFSLSL